MQIKQVEFNTIAASFGALAERSAKLHRYLAATSRSYWRRDTWLADVHANVPHNESIGQIVFGMAKAVESYTKSRARWGAPIDEHGKETGAKPVVLFVVQENERNLFDQEILQYELLQRSVPVRFSTKLTNSYGILSVRRSFRQVQEQMQITPPDNTLRIPGLPGEQFPPHEVALIYYRAGYTPNDYTREADWETRIALERTSAIKCPSMALQLAGAKKVQQVLAEPGVLERFLLGPNQPDMGFGAGAGSLTPAHLATLRKTWVGLYPMDDSAAGKKAYELALRHADQFVLKPQREGGGNNIYRSAIPPALAQLAKEDREAKRTVSSKSGYILMELIHVPKNVRNLLVRSGQDVPVLTNVVSELGVYGVTIFGGGGRTQVNRFAGTLLRTKSEESDEGGVAIGISSVDTPLLVG